MPALLSFQTEPEQILTLRDTTSGRCGMGKTLNQGSIDIERVHSHNAREKSSSLKDMSSVPRNERKNKIQLFERS